MDTKKLVFLLLGRWPLILISAILGALLVYGYSAAFMTPVYEAKATMIVKKNAATDTNTEQSNDYNDVLMTQKLVKTYSIIMKSNTVLQSVISSLGINITPDELNKIIRIEGKNDTEVLEITVENTDRELAAKIANTLTQLAPEKILNFTNAVSANVVDEARVPTKPSKPNKIQYALFGALLGLAFSVLIVIIKDYFDDTFKSEEDIRNFLDIPVLASLPELAEDKSSK